MTGRFAAGAARSLLVLHALGLVASPTTSLPDVVGSERGADGRLIRTGDVAGWAMAASASHLEEDADAAVAWLLAAIDECPVPDELGLDGSAPPSERVLGLLGWRGSEPVRVGHDAPEQPEVDATCAVLSAATALAATAAGQPLLDRWDQLVDLAGWVARAELRRGEVGRLLVVRRVLSAMSGLAWERNPLDLDAVGWHAVRKSSRRGCSPPRAPIEARWATARTRRCCDRPGWVRGRPTIRWCGPPSTGSGPS